MDRLQQRGVIGTGKIGPADRAREERVTDEQIEPLVVFRTHLKTHAAWRVTRGLVDADQVVSERDGFATLIRAIWWWLTLHVKSEHESLLNDGVVQGTVCVVEPHWRLERRFGAADPGDVIEMRVGQQNVRDRQPRELNRRDHVVNFVAWIDDDGLARGFAAQDVAVLVERRRGMSRQQHG